MSACPIHNTFVEVIGPVQDGFSQDSSVMYLKVLDVIVLNHLSQHLAELVECCFT